MKKRKTQREIGVIEGIILAVDSMKTNMISYPEIEWIIESTDLSMDEMKKYNPDILKIWEEDEDFINSVKNSLIKNNKTESKRIKHE